jgi:glutamate dehydrogenase (NAD(P)+)
MGTNEQTMAWIMDTYSMHMRHTVTAVVTGKPLDLGGSRGRREATGRGILMVTDEALKKMEMNREETRVIIQGFGNVGSNAAKLMFDQGYRIVGVSEIGGALYNPKGIDIDALMEHRMREGSLLSYPEAQRVDPGEFLLMECDVLVPAATENVITSQNAAQVKARILVEGANGPTTAAADEILQDKHVFVMPDILANAGGVTVSYFEWVQNIENEQWDLDEVNHKLRVKMDRATDTVIDTQRLVNTSLSALEAERQRREPEGGPLQPVDLRTAALIVAVRRVAQVALERGIWP